MCIIKLPESLQNMQESETEQVEIAKGIICSFTCYVRGHILFLSLHIKKKQRKNIILLIFNGLTLSFPPFSFLPSFWFINSFIPTIHSFIHSCIDSFIDLLIHSSIHLCIYSVIQSFSLFLLTKVTQGLRLIVSS